jgi:hypothetical protein
VTFVKPGEGTVLAPQCMHQLGCGPLYPHGAHPADTLLLIMLLMLMLLV